MSKEPKQPNVKQEYVGKLANQQTLDNRWWQTPVEELPANVKAVVDSIDKAQSTQRIMNLKYARLYSNLELLGFITGGTVRNNTDAFINNRVTYNIVKSTIDTAKSKIAKNKPKIQFLTEDGDFGLQRKAQNLTKYIEGVFYDTDLYSKAQKTFTHSCVFGTGALKIFKKDGKICVESVFIEEIKVDDIEGAYGKPRQIHQVKYISRDILLASYPDHHEAILSATAGDITRGSITYTADMIEVTESWHLRSGMNVGDGRHSISIEGATLFDEEYEKDYFPFVFLRWNDRLAGFFGQGLAEELIGIQIEINKILKNIQKAQHLLAVPRIAIDSSSKVSAATITNEIGAMFKYAGNPPTFFTPTAMNGEVYNHLKWLIQSAYEVSGISQLSATSKKPAGLDAAVALREFQDIETERFMITAQNYEKVFMEATEIIIDMSRDIYVDDPNLKTKTNSSKFIQSIKWKDVCLDDDQFVMKMFPVSLLPSSPAGKLQKVQELLQAGFIDQQQALSLLDFPDLDNVQNLAMASLKLTEKQLYVITNDGKYSNPEPQQDLTYSIALAQQVYIKSKLNNLPEERLDLVLRYIDDAERLLAQTQPPVEAPIEAPVEPPVEATPEMSTIPTAPLQT
jgi:hypothetical protein